jgi:hypothetical protein
MSKKKPTEKIKSDVWRKIVDEKGFLSLNNRKRELSWCSGNCSNCNMDYVEPEEFDSYEEYLEYIEDENGLCSLNVFTVERFKKFIVLERKLLKLLEYGRIRRVEERKWEISCGGEKHVLEWEVVCLRQLEIPGLMCILCEYKDSNMCERKFLKTVYKLNGEMIFKDDLEWSDLHRVWNRKLWDMEIEK